MPRLIIFGICQKAIMDKLDNTISMIGLFNSVTVQIPAEENVPDNAMIQLSWSAIASWKRNLPEDDGKTFQQKVQVFLPNNELFASAIAESQLFGMEGTFSNIIQTSQGFPIGYQGSYTVKVYLREVKPDGSEISEWEERGSAPFDIIYFIQEGIKNKEQPS